MKKLKNLLITGLTLGMLSLPKVVVSPVQNVNLDREIFTDKSTSGILYVDQNNNGRYDLGKDEFLGYTLEQTWRDNKKDLSSIPLGYYNVRPGLTNKFERHFRVQDVKDRKSILFHGYSSYNKKDFLTNENTQGCILVDDDSVDNFYFGENPFNNIFSRWNDVLYFESLSDVPKTFKDLIIVF